MRHGQPAARGRARVAGAWVRRAAWVGGAPVRLTLLAAIAAYRLTLGQVIGGNCRFYPSCSEYAAGAVRNAGAVRGLALAVWRVVRCSPLSRGGVDRPPGSSVYDGDIHRCRSGAAGMPGVSA